MKVGKDDFVAGSANESSVFFCTNVRKNVCIE